MQRKVSEVINTFEQLDAQQLRNLKGLNLEAYKGSADPRSRTIRIDDNHRGIVLDAGDNENYVLTRICIHDDAELWMTTNTFKVNHATGALEVLDVQAVAAAISQGSAHVAA